MAKGVFDRRGAVSGPSAMRLGGHARRVRDMGTRSLKRLLKGPLVRIRSFLIAPVHDRLEAQQSFLSDAADRLLAIEHRLLAVEPRLLAVEHRLLPVEHSLLAVGHSVGLLHRKADEGAVKSRPVVHLRDAYAIPLADGYLFVPQEEEALLEKKLP